MLTAVSGGSYAHVQVWDRPDIWETEIRFDDRPVTSVADLTTLLKEDADSLGTEFQAPVPPVWYRGQADATGDLLPTMGRNPALLGREVAILNRFKQDTPLALFDLPASEWDWLFLGRHHGLASRLLDWSESPLFGLYFAVSEFTGPAGNRPQSAEEEQAEGCIWCLLPTLLNGQRFSTNSVEIPMFDDPESGLDTYLPASIQTSLRGQQIGSSTIPPAAGLGMRKDARMQSQLSVFTIMHNNLTTISDARPDGLHVWRYMIPPECKAPIRCELAMLGISQLTLFPELDNVASSAARLGHG